MVGWTLMVTVPGGAPLRETEGAAESTRAAWEQVLDAAEHWVRAGGRGTLELSIEGRAPALVRPQLDNLQASLTAIDDLRTWLLPDDGRQA